MPTSSDSPAGVEVDKVLSKRLADLVSSLKASSEALANLGVSKWCKLYSDKPDAENVAAADQPGKSLDGLNSKEFVTAFNRDQSQKAYINAVQIKEGDKPQSFRVAQAAKLQLDLLAGLERDLRMRYRSRTRMLAHGIARLSSHGIDDGPINACTLNVIKLMVESAKAQS